MTFMKLLTAISCVTGANSLFSVHVPRQKLNQTHVLSLLVLKVRSVLETKRSLDLEDLGRSS